MSWWDSVRGAAKYALPVVGGVGGFMVGGPGGAIAGVAGGTALGGVISADEQKDEAKKAAAKQREAIEKEREAQESAGQEASRLIGESSGTARGYLERGYRDASGRLVRGKTSQLAELGLGYGGASRDYERGISGARSALNEGAEGALSEIDRGYADSKLAQLWSPEFKTDPGYEFRLGQGNEALSRAGAAAGGRLSGAALKKLSEYNQGFASNEYSNWFGRMSGIGSQLDSASQAQGIARSNIRGGLGSSLAGLSERSGQYQSGLTSSYYGNRANIEGSTAAQLSGLESGIGSSLANLTTGTASNQANALTGSAANSMNLTLAGLPSYAASVPYSGAAWNAYSSGMNNLTNLAAFGYGSGMFGSGGGAGGGAPSGGQYLDVGRDPNALNKVYGTPYAPSGYYQ